jgi:hypothetical protein
LKLKKTRALADFKIGCVTAKNVDFELQNKTQDGALYPSGIKIDPELLKIKNFSKLLKISTANNKLFLHVKKQMASGMENNPTLPETEEPKIM